MRARPSYAEIGATKLEATPRVWRLPDCSFGLWTFDRGSGAILAANPAACRIYGYTREQLRRSCADEICRSPCGSLLDLDLQVSPQDETVWHRRRDHSTFQTDISIIANTSQNGSTATVLVHPLILSGHDAVFTSALPPLPVDVSLKMGPFPSASTAPRLL